MLLEFLLIRNFIQGQQRVRHKPQIEIVDYEPDYVPVEKMPLGAKIALALIFGYLAFILFLLIS